MKPGNLYLSHDLPHHDQPTYDRAHFSVVALRYEWQEIGGLWIYISAANDGIWKYHLGTDSKYVIKTKLHDNLE